MSEKRTIVLSAVGCGTIVTAAYFAIKLNFIPFSVGLLISFVGSLYLGLINKGIPATIIAAVLTLVVTLFFLSFCLSLPAFMGYIAKASDLFIFANIAWLIKFFPIIFASCFFAGIIGCIIQEFLL